MGMPLIYIYSPMGSSVPCSYCSHGGKALLFLCDGAEEFLAGGGEPVYSLLQQADGGAQLLLVLKQHGHVHVDVPHRAVVPLELSHGLLKHNNNNNNNTFINKLVNIIGEKNAKYQIIIIIMIITSISSKSLSSKSFLQYRYEWIMYEQKKLIQMPSLICYPCSW